MNDKERAVLEAARKYASVCDPAYDNLRHAPEMELVRAVREWQRPRYEVKEQPVDVEMKIWPLIVSDGTLIYARCPDHSRAAKVAAALNSAAEKETP